MIFLGSYGSAKAMGLWKTKGHKYKHGPNGPKQVIIVEEERLSEKDLLSLGRWLSASDIAKRR